MTNPRCDLCGKKIRARSWVWVITLQVHKKCRPKT